jgi:hypothetical protein
MLVRGGRSARLIKVAVAAAESVESKRARLVRGVDSKLAEVSK